MSTGGRSTLQQTAGRGPCGELRGELCSSGDASPDNPGNVNATCAKHKTAWMLAGMKTGM